MLPASLSHLPFPPPEAQALSARLVERIHAEIRTADGWISFSRFMELALYAPRLGYYSAGSTKLGSAGDFVTAPELSPLFAQCLARQVAQLIEANVPDIIELGAGSGTLAAGLLEALSALGRPPEHYFILEVSGDLRERQRTLLAGRMPHLIDRVHWLDAFPANTKAVLIANEVLDAIPAQIVHTRGGKVEEMGVTTSATTPGFERAYRPAAGELLRAAESLRLPDDYETEINLAAAAFVRSFARILERGALLLIDYGFPAGEYYHPERSQGTLMCHYRHHAHDDPFVLLGLQDITAHVEFTAIAAAGVDAGLHVLGFTTQAQFLVNLGITDLLAETRADEVRAYAPLAASAQKLLSPAEMGELFKVLALGRGIEGQLIGFARGDRAHTL